MANLNNANLCSADLNHTNLGRAKLSGTNLNNANLCNAILSYTDLKNADLDFSCLPLWCGSLRAEFDDRQIAQFAYHMVKAGLASKNVSDKTKNELKKIISLANTFHRSTECGKIKED